MATNKGVDALKGTWDFVSGDSMDEYLKSLGVNKIARMMANNAKPRLTISEDGGKWTLSTDGGLKSKTVEFVPDIEYETTAADGREVKGIVHFENGKWIENVQGEKGKEITITRWVDHNDQQNVTFEFEKGKLNRFFKRVK